MKYQYEKLTAMVYDSKDFTIDHMREAVEYLKTQPQTEFTAPILLP